jgi:LysM repeat protein
MPWSCQAGGAVSATLSWWGLPGALASSTKNFCALGSRGVAEAETADAINSLREHFWFAVIVALTRHLWGSKALIIAQRGRGIDLGLRVLLFAVPRFSTIFLEKLRWHEAELPVVSPASDVPRSRLQMTSTDLCRPNKNYVHTRVSLRKPLRCGLTIVMCSCLFAGAAQCRARAPQDVAEAARQERARKAEQRKSKHVYTDEDLSRAKILTPEDEARAEAARKELPALHPDGIEAPLDANLDLPQLPLGDIARRYREAKRAAQIPDAFHLPFDEPVFAAPVISMPSLEPPRPSFAAVHPNFVASRPHAAIAPPISNAAPVRRVDPFTRRLAPVPPASVSRTAPAIPETNAGSAVASTTAPMEHSGSPRIVTVEPGDSLWKLAQQNLGRGSRWHELLAANPGILDPTHLAAGTKIAVPNETTKLANRKSETKIVVEKGDMLTKIAQSQYRRATAWRCIVQANPEIRDPNRIYEGQQLLLPFECKQ